MGHVSIAAVTNFDIEVRHTTCDAYPLVEGVPTPLSTLTVEQPDFVFRPPAAMIDPAPQVIGMALERITGHVRSPRRQRGLDRPCRASAEPFIGVKAEHPLMRGMAYGAIFLRYVAQKCL